MYRCEYCSNEYTRRDALKRHQLTAHNSMSNQVGNGSMMVSGPLRSGKTKWVAMPLKRMPRAYGITNDDIKEKRRQKEIARRKKHYIEEHQKDSRIF